MLSLLMSISNGKICDRELFVKNLKNLSPEFSIFWLQNRRLAELKILGIFNKTLVAIIDSYLAPIYRFFRKVTDP